MNHIAIIGNLASDPESHTTQSGINRSTFRVAVQRRFRNAQGEREADFFTVVAWRQTADFCNNYLTKGRKVAVEGAMQARQYDAQDGSKRTVWELIAENVEALEKAPEGRREGAQEAHGQFTEVEDDENLPF